MNAHTITSPCQGSAPDWPSAPAALARGLVAQARGLELAAMLATRVAVALVPAVAIVTAASLAIATPGMAVWLQVLLWVSGFLFYAAAIDSERGLVAALLLVSGTAVQASAWASAQQSGELGVAGAALVAAWVAFSLLRRP